MSLFSSPELKVGLMVLGLTGIIATMSLQVSRDPGYLGSTMSTWFYIDDASGLVRNSAVRMSGINVGTIRDIRLERGFARIEMVLKGDLPITQSARIEIRPSGILGDKHIEIISGDPRDPPLRSGEQIVVVDDRASVDRVLTEISRITHSLTDVAENLRGATEGDVDKPLGKILFNLETLTADLAEFSSDRGGQLGEIVEHFNNVAVRLDHMVNDTSADGFQAAWKDALQSLSSIQNSLNNVEEISAKINRGEGTLGRLVNDETTVDEINVAVQGINTFLDTAAKTKTSFDFYSHYLMESDRAKSTLSLRLQPGLDRYYEVALVDAGVVSEESRRIIDTDGTTSVVTEEKLEDRLKFNALFAKNFWNWTLKGGVIENSGGFGADYYAFRRNIRLSLEVFEFSEPNVRASARWNLLHGVYLMGGAEDIAGQSTGINPFFGGGIFLTNDDLRLLLGQLSF